VDSSSIDLPGSEIESIEQEGRLLRIRFSRAYIIKTMTGSEERTRWWQRLDLLLEGAEAEGNLPEGPLTCAGGELQENIYTYRDMVPTPLESRGNIRCELQFRGREANLNVQAEAVRLVAEAPPKYIEHIRPISSG
jgi:hypothetical protein